MGGVGGKWVDVVVKGWRWVKLDKSAGGPRTSCGPGLAHRPVPKARRPSQSPRAHSKGSLAHSTGRRPGPEDTGQGHRPEPHW